MQVMSTLNIVRLHRLYEKVKAPARSIQAVRVTPLLDGGRVCSFHIESLFRLRGQVASLLSQLPDSMMQSHTSSLTPWIFARYDWKHRLWTHSLSDVDLLLAMGRSLHMVSVHIPDYPCTLPHVQILDTEARANEKLSPQCNIRLSRWDYRYLRVE